MAKKYVIKKFTASRLYHAFLRTVPGNRLFRCAKDARYFVKCVQSSIEEMPAIGVVCYSVMSTHFHLMVWQRTERAITTFMKKVILKYRYFFGKKYGWVGPLFENPYMAKEILTVSYFLKALAYIVGNPDDSGREDWQKGDMSRIVAAEVWWNVTKEEVMASLIDDVNILGGENGSRRFLIEENRSPRKGAGELVDEIGSGKESVVSWE